MSYNSYNSYNSSDLHKLNKDELVYLITILQEQNTITKNKAEKVEIEKFVEYVELSPDFIGSTITAVYKHKHKNEYGQRYSSYDDGSILVFEYKTKDGKKCFSIGNGNIHSPNSVPIDGTFLFDEKQTNMLLKWGNPESDVICPNCDGVYGSDEIMENGKCEDCVNDEE
jgi:hypothetical protein